MRFLGRHRWTGWATSGALTFTTPTADIEVTCGAVLLALGGASWPRMGSDGDWVAVLRARGVQVSELRATNCGVDIPWSPVFVQRFEGQPLKRIAVSVGQSRTRGEAVVTRAGLEGGAVYAVSAPIRRSIDARGYADLRVDLVPDLSAEALALRVDGARQGRSLPNFLRQKAGLSPVAIGLVQEALHAGAVVDRLSCLLKHLPLRTCGMQPLERAISTAGGVALDELDAGLMLRRLPGVFAAGEMLDWEAPTGGYLLQGCFSTAMLAARGLQRWLDQPRPEIAAR